jgi:radical SAM superfamily enzyme YgiQ (UPF0313 family)
MKVVLVNPAIATFGFSFMTPRWLYVLAAATPSDSVGDPLVVDECLKRFDPNTVEKGDIVGIGITSGNCQAGYRVLRQVKARGAIAIMGGIHATIFPNEPLEFGADAVVTGNGDLVWPIVVEDVLKGRLRRTYTGGRVDGERLAKARWDLLTPSKYMLPTVQTIAGCPENCSFCSVWITDGRKPRARLAEKVIDEVNELYTKGFRYVVFADDNFNPATLGRIARETDLHKRKELEQLREQRLRFFDQYDARVPADMYAFTQMTSEIVSDREYLSAMYDKMRIRAALMGVESLSEAGLVSAGKEWNPVGQKMVDTIQRVQDAGIMVLSSVICGLESDTPETLRKGTRFLLQSGTMLANFTMFRVYPGTVDYFQMARDQKHIAVDGYQRKHATQFAFERYWLRPDRPVNLIRHPHMTGEQLLEEHQRCWDTFYALSETLKRVMRHPIRTWPLHGRLIYTLFCTIFKRVYAEHGIAADSVQGYKGVVTETLIRIGSVIYGRWFRRKHLVV